MEVDIKCWGKDEVREEVRDQHVRKAAVEVSNG